MAHLDRVAALARQFLTIVDAQGRADVWLWEHSERVMRLTQMLGRLPEFDGYDVNLEALAVAGLFHDAGWAVQAREGKVDRWQVLSRPTSDIQRELAIGLMQEQVRHLVANETIRVAAEAVRGCNDRHTRVPEAQVLAEAENLDDVGVLNILRQFRHYQAEGRALDQLCAGWTRQQEYSYWEARINEGLRLEVTRRLARERLQAVQQLMTALTRDCQGRDVETVLHQAGAGAAPVTAD